MFQKVFWFVFEENMFVWVGKKNVFLRFSSFCLALFGLRLNLSKGATLDVP